MSVYALNLASGADTAARVRSEHLLTLPPGTAPLLSASALRPDGGGAVAVVAGSMTVTVSPFVAWAQSATAAQGGYPFVCDAAVTLTVGAGHPSLTRVDTVAAVVRDDAFDGSGSTDARVIVIAGTPGAGAPALPATCVPLRDITVPAGTSAGGGGLQASNLSTDRRTYLPLRGKGLLVARSPLQNTIGWTNPTTNQTFPDGAERNAVRQSFTKILDASALEVDLSISLALTSGESQQIRAGLRIDAAQDSPDICASRFQTAAPARVFMTGYARLTGVAAGTHTIEPWIRGAAAVIYMYFGDDSVSFKVREVV